jgi:hypothetical protein
VKKAIFGAVVLLALVELLLLVLTSRTQALQYARDQASVRILAEFHVRSLKANNIPGEKYLSELRDLQAKHRHEDPLLDQYVDQVRRLQEDNEAYRFDDMDQATKQPVGDEKKPRN